MIIFTYLISIDRRNYRLKIPIKSETSTRNFLNLFKYEKNFFMSSNANLQYKFS